MKIRMVVTRPEEYLARKDPELASWLLGYEVLRDVAAYWLNAMEKGSKEGKVNFSANQ